MSTDYGSLHTLAVEFACEELIVLPDSHDEDGNCVVPVAVCIHDEGPDNPGCGGASTAECAEFADGLGTTVDPKSNGLMYVEVRACYPFRTLAGNIVVSFPFGSGIDLGDIPLLKSRTFAVADY